MASRITPAGPPPLGSESNFDNPQSLYPYILATVIICSSLITVFATARLLTKWLLSKWALEDYVLILAWATNIAYNFLFLAQGQAGEGRHLWDIRAVDAARLSRLSWIISMLYCPTTWLAKTAILLQIMHIFTTTRSGLVYWAIHALIWLNLVFYTSVLFSTIFECVPQEKIWNPQRDGGHCININVAYASTGSVNVLSDLLILLLPVWATWRLRMALKRRLRISAVFATGFIAFTSSICRLVYTTRFFHSLDTPYIAAQVGMWTLAEVSSINLCTCFPVMPRFTQLILSKAHGSPDPESHPSDLGVKTIFGGRSEPFSRNESYDAEVWARGRDDLTPLKSTYLPLEQQDHEKPRNSSVKHNRIQRTVSIELTRRDV